MLDGLGVQALEYWAAAKDRILSYPNREVYIDMCMHTYLFVLLYIYIYLFIHIIYIYVYIYMYIYTLCTYYIYIYMYIYTLCTYYIYVYIHVHKCIYTTQQLNNIMGFVRPTSEYSGGWWETCLVFYLLR